MNYKVYLSNIIYFIHTKMSVFIMCCYNDIAATNVEYKRKLSFNKLSCLFVLIVNINILKASNTIVHIPTHRGQAYNYTAGPLQYI